MILLILGSVPKWPFDFHGLQRNAFDNSKSIKQFYNKTKQLKKIQVYIFDINI